MKSPITKFTVVGLLVLVVVIGWIAWGTVKQARAKRIVNVFTRLNVCQASSIIPAQRPGNKGREAIFSVQKYAQSISQIDVSTCPENFQAAWMNYTKAVQEFSAHDNVATAGLAFLTLLNGNGKSAVALNELVSDVKVSLLQMKQIAVQDGVKFTN